jgi:transcription termination factor Rho
MSINITHFRSLPIEELVQEAQALGIDNAGNFRPSELVFELVCHKVNRGDGIIGNGILEILSDGFGFLRSPVSGYAPGTDDIYVSPSQIRRFNLRTGDWVTGKARIPRDNERYLALLQIKEVNGRSPEDEKRRLHFNSMTVGIREDLIEWSSTEWSDVHSQLNTTKGSRIVFLFEQFQNNLPCLTKLIANLATDTILTLINVPPEDVHLIRKKWSGEVYASYRGDSPIRHQQVMQIATYRAKRLTEQGRDVNLVVSSLNEIALAERNIAEQSDQTGAQSIGVVAAQKLLSQGRNFTHGGSLTVWAGIHRGRSSFEVRLQDRLLYEASGRYIYNSSEPALIDMEKSLQFIDQL